MARRIPPPPPAVPTGGHSCDAGHCDGEAVGWRWFTDLRRWLPVCARDMNRKGVPREFRHYDHEYSGGRS